MQCETDREQLLESGTITSEKMADNNASAAASAAKELTVTYFGIASLYNFQLVKNS